ncbi:zinc ribbon domain-containing protein [Streptomyces marokkonensis]|uniref:zinc ribbon domain-containing protein n=1 Tax=Streptomyces marokkonensis TaxID=324855 RepID=UPI0031E9D28F
MPGSGSRTSSSTRPSGQTCPLVFVEPAYTSQTCAESGHVGKRNRVGQGLFICRGCGVVAHADRNASHSIATRGESVRNAGRESRVPATPQRGVRTEESTPAASRALPPSPPPQLGV